jgi:hypothetical protein
MKSIKQLIDLIGQLSYRHSAWEVFSDFVEMAAIAVSNSVDWNQREAREKRYLEVLARYNAKEQEVFPKLLASLIEALEDELTMNGPGDLLGTVFHELELHNKWKGQFFTPDGICEMMGEVVIGEQDLNRHIKDKGFITLSEPACGSGAMVLGFCRAMQKRKLNCCSQLVVTAVDVDLKCVAMAYLQFSLYGIPAVVIHGNTLLVEEWSRWYTPVYIMDGWSRRQRCVITERVKVAPEPMGPMEIIVPMEPHLQQGFLF